MQHIQSILQIFKCTTIAKIGKFLLRNGKFILRTSRIKITIVKMIFTDFSYKFLFGNKYYNKQSTPTDVALPFLEVYSSFIANSDTYKV